MKLTLIRVLCVLLIIAALGLYAYEVLAKGDRRPKTCCEPSPLWCPARVR